MRFKNWYCLDKEKKKDKDCKGQDKIYQANKEESLQDKNLCMSNREVKEVMEHQEEFELEHNIEVFLII